MANSDEVMDEPFAGLEHSGDDAANETCILYKTEK